MNAPTPSAALPRSLPEVTGFDGVRPETWQGLATRLRDAGFGPGYLDPRGADRQQPLAALLARSLRRHLCRQRADPMALAERMFQLRDPVPARAVRDWLGDALLDRLIDGGLLTQPTADTVVSDFDLRVYRGLLLLCDDLDHAGDAVFGVGPGTAAFVLPRPLRRPLSTALDLGCGAGAVALWLASRVPRVVGTDINPRALVFARVNAALSRITNVEWRQGDVFAPVDGECFDWIGSQPPYVPWPGAAAGPGDASASTTGPATYLHAGPRGDAVLARVVAGVPDHLTATGRAQIVFDQPLTDRAAGMGESWPFQPAGGASLRTLVVLGAPLPAQDYALRQALPTVTRLGMEAFDADLNRWYAHLARMGVAAVSPAVALLEPAPSEPDAVATAGWHVVLHAGQGLWNEIGPLTLERLWAGHDWLQRRRSAANLPAPRVRVPTDCNLVRPLAVERGGPGVLHLALPTDCLFGAVGLEPAEWERLQRLHDGLPPDSPEAAHMQALAAGLGLVDV